MDIKNKIMTFFSNLSPEKKRQASLAAVIISLVAVGVFGYTSKMNRNHAIAPVEEAKKKDISLDSDLLEKSAYREQQQELRSSSEELKLLRSELDAMKKNQVEKQSEAPKIPAKGVPPFPSSSQTNTNNDLPTYPPAPVPPPGSSRQSMGPGGKPMESNVMIGGIEIMSHPMPAQMSGEAGGKKKAPERIYLPPSYMEASLLSGLDAPTSESASKNPIPVMIRVKNIAVLPNKVKADLKGCFIIADGMGNLASERCELRLTSLTCLSKNGSAVIDQKIKGFVVDGDGKIGLAGRVVAKMGAMLARSAIGGFLGGIGDGLKAASTVTMTSSTGALQTINSGDLFKTAAGSGVASAAHDLQKFYLELARQTLPVIEIGSARDITVVIEEGVDLEIKNLACRNNSLEAKCQAESAN